MKIADKIKHALTGILYGIGYVAMIALLALIIANSITFYPIETIIISALILVALTAYIYYRIAVGKDAAEESREQRAVAQKKNKEEKL